MRFAEPGTNGTRGAKQRAVARREAYYESPRARDAGIGLKERDSSGNRSAITRKTTSIALSTQKRATEEIENAPSGNRTPDLPLTRRVLYQLS